eukprot:COSAG02_NODE_3154_length_7266_cov_5.826287_4_plen_164_part_00
MASKGSTSTRSARQSRRCGWSLHQTERSTSISISKRLANFKGLRAKWLSTRQSEWSNRWPSKDNLRDFYPMFFGLGQCIANSGTTYVPPLAITGDKRRALHVPIDPWTGARSGVAGQRCMALSTIGVMVGETRGWLDDLVEVAAKLEPNFTQIVNCGVDWRLE